MNERKNGEKGVVEIGREKGTYFCPCWLGSVRGVVHVYCIAFGVSKHSVRVQRRSQ
jgi:hypothetical protein